MVAAVGRPDPHSWEVPVAYVKVGENEEITKEQIMNWAREHVGEKAAVPREVIITRQIPLTPVGKIFKPALRWDATRRALKRNSSRWDLPPKTSRWMWARIKSRGPR